MAPRASDSATPTTKAKGPRGRNFLDPRIATAMGHPIRNDALTILNERVASPNEISKELGEPVTHVSYHVKVLLECDCIELVDTVPRRGAMEHYYQATCRAFLRDPEWERLPESIRPGMSADLLNTIVHDVSESLKAGKIDARDDRHLSWTPMIVDEQGWGEITGVLEESLNHVLEIQAASAGRMAAADEEGTAVSVAILCFESAAPGGKRVRPSRKS